LHGGRKAILKDEDFVKVSSMHGHEIIRSKRRTFHTHSGSFFSKPRTGKATLIGSIRQDTIVSVRKVKIRLF
jgi:hypothetical protein